MNILVTGGAGFIGSHTSIELINSGHFIVIVDDLSNSSVEIINALQKISGHSVSFYQINLCDKEKSKQVFQKYNFDAVIHFAGLKAVGESVCNPLQYYRSNLDSTITLLELMEEFNINKLIFSSSATVYGKPTTLPIKESAIVGLGITNPYGQTKYMNEVIIKDFVRKNKKVGATLLRYFNPIGAHPSGLIGESPSGTPNNLFPYILQVADGSRKELLVFGNDYETPDGTGVRDYIHVVDLAKGHLAALENISSGIQIYNLGTGQGISVLGLINSFKEVTGIDIPYHFVNRRDGDIASCYADVSLVNRSLGWKTNLDINQACQDGWRWQSGKTHNVKGL